MSQDVGSLAELKLSLSAHPGLNVVHFWATWAPQSSALDDVLELLREELDPQLVRFYRVEAEEEPEISVHFQVASVPCVLYFAQSRLLERIEGAKPAEIAQRTRTLASNLALDSKMGKTSDQSHSQMDPDELETRLKALINANKLMLFMKGSPAAPQCGFSKKTVALLDQLNADYGHFDILTDNEVRQGLKILSKWPTYPQLYLDGELLGGIDVLNEMEENGELDDMLPKKAS